MVRKILLVIILVIFAGCITKDGVIKENIENQITAEKAPKYIYEQIYLPQQLTVPDIVVPIPTLLPTPTKLPSSTQLSSTIERLDFSSIDGLDSTRKEWGIKLMGNDTPIITQEQKSLLEKYNAYFIGDTSQKKVYLLFSAGFEGGYTGKILDTLKKHNVKAMFFLVGDYVELEPALVKRMLDEGHVIGNHSFRHSYLSDINNDKLEYEILEYDKYFREKYNISFKYFMPPSGVYSEKVLAAAKQLGYTTLFWSFAYVDFDVNKQLGPDNTYNLIMKNLHNGAFLFLHTVSRDNAEALDKIIIDIKAKNFEIGLVDF